MVVLNDSDDDIPRSPGLKPINFKYTPPRSPISFVPRRRPMTDSEPSGQESRKRNRESREGRSRPCQGDVVLLGHLDPNRPDIATTAGQQTLFASDSSSEHGDDETGSKMDEDGDTTSAARIWPQPGRRSPKRYQNDTSSTPRAIASGGPVTAGADAEMPDAPAMRHDQHKPGHLRHRSQSDDTAAADSEYTRRKSYGSVEALRKPDRMESYPLGPGFEPGRSFSAKRNHPVTLPSVSDSIASSPQLRQHMLTAPQGSPQNLDQPSMGPLNSPQNPEQRLPPVQSLMKAVAQGEEVRNQNRPRTTSVSSAGGVLAPAPPPHASGSSASATSPRFFTNHPPQSSASLFSIPRVQTDPTPLPPPNPANIRPLGHSSTNPADFAMNSGANTHVQPSGLSMSSTASTTTAGATPGSTNDGASPHPTPSDRSATIPLPISPEESNHGALSPTSTSNPAGGPTLYKCTHPGCRAPPFQTPYLLNSHRNVHSSDRPYFCPRKDCPRSLPGKGFKRKNEMLRHGLVHNSPGYVCPFCSPEKEHRYPRPDNLQRHVRMHHEDVDPEDARLREVLGQRRTTGGGGKHSATSGFDMDDDSGEPASSSVLKGKVAELSTAVSGSSSQRGRRRKGTG